MSRKRSRTAYAAIAFVAIAVVALVLYLASLKKAPSPAPSPPVATAPERVGPPSVYPDASRTPGAPNPSITQANIDETICNPHWSTRSVRPPESYTSKLKREQLEERGLPGGPADYEEDHLIPLELGGSPADPRNLWPERYHPKPGAREKDVVESYLHKQVCTGGLTLEEAQRAIATDWYKVYLAIPAR